MSAARRVHWQDYGTGAPAVLLHCALAHSSAFAGVMAGLRDRLAMRALDLPGHGRTQYDPGRDFHDQALADALAALGETGPGHLIGHSVGGTVALRAAVRRPDLVRGLVLIEPVFFAFLADAGHPGYAAEMEASAAFAAAARARDWRAAAQTFLDRWGPPGGLDRLLPEQAAYMIARIPLVVASEPAILDTPAPRLRLGEIGGLAMPVLVIEGARSPAVVGQILDVIGSVLPQARRVRIAGAGHMSPVTHAAEVSDAIVQFLGRNEAE